MDTNRFSIKRRLKSFRYAFSGLRVLVREEHNARIHLFATVCVIVMGVAFRISCTEWMAVAFAIGLVFGMEAVNSAVENICDFVCPERDARIKKIKDLAAAAVLLSAIAALAVGLFIFIPKIMSLCHGA
ncbi:MAG: diacylglycerol kinase family protein [Bacteroidales bacterium]|nr:diacylglycerol kinase family protein [Bacteroidales bacterium]